MNSVFCFDQFELDCRAFELRHSGAAVRIDAIVLRLLETLVRNPGQLVSKDKLISEVWTDRVVTENALAVAVARLRKMLEDYGMPRASVVTVHRYGYRFTRRVSSSVGGSASASLAARSSAELTGRERVMLQLKRALFEAQHNSGRLVALRGEAGIGKTRIAETFAEYAARAGCVVAWGHCREQGATPPLWPIVELLRSVMRDIGAAPADGYAVPPELSPLLPDMATSGNGSGAQTVDALGTKSRVFDAVTRTLVNAATKSPLVLILDELHRADEASLELLRYLLANISRTRILLVATLRHVYGDAALASPLATVITHRNCVRVAVEPLSPQDVASYLAEHFGTVDRALCQKVYELSEGNPFCMVELARPLSDGTKANAAALTIPKVASDLVRQRLGVLDEDTFDVLSVAAVIGRVFSLPLLAAVMNRHATPIMAILDRACAADVISTATGFGIEFRFTHGLLHSAFYDGQGPAERRMRHLRVRETLERRRTLAEVSCAELAFHAHAALPGGDLHKAVEYCVEAANMAEQKEALGDAIRHLQDARQALDLIEDASPYQRFQLILQHARLVRAHSSHEFLPLADQLMRLARELGGAPLAVASLLVAPFPGFPRLSMLHSPLSEALAALANDTPSLRPALMARLASSVPLAYDATGSYAQIEHALALAQHSPDRADRFSAHFGELYLYGGPAHTERASAALTTLHRLCNETEHDGPVPLPWMLVDLHLVLTCLQRGDVAQTMRALDRWELRCRNLGGEPRWFLDRMRALVQINLGQSSEGRSALLRLHRDENCCDDHSGRALLCAYDQHLLLASGEVAYAPRAELLPDAHDPPNIWALKLRALEAAGALEDARSALLLVPAERLRELPCDREFLGTMGALARTALRLEARHYVQAIYECLSPFPEYFAVNLSGLCEGSVSLLLGLLAQFTGDGARARAHFDAAVARSEHAGFLHCADEARDELARCPSPSQVRTPVETSKKAFHAANHLHAKRC